VAVVFVPSVRVEAVRATKALRDAVAKPIVLDVMGRGLGAQLKQASAIGASFAVIIGPKEVEEGKLTLREMSTGSQESLSLGEIAERLAR